MDSRIERKKCLSLHWFDFRLVYEKGNEFFIIWIKNSLYYLLHLVYNWQMIFKRTLKSLEKCYIAKDVMEKLTRRL